MHVVRTDRGPARPRRTLGAATLVALTLLAMPGAGVASANRLSAPTVSPDPRATVPMTISISGTADTPSILRVFVQPSTVTGCAGGGSGTANADAQAARAGSTEVIRREAAAAFAYSATYTPASAGSYSLCAYLYGTTAATGSSQVATNFGVGPAPPPPPAVTGPPPAKNAPTSPVRTRCHVPQLKGRTYLGARKLLRSGGCSVGTVYRPTRTAPNGMVLRVVWQLPKAYSARKLNSRITLRLGFVKRSRA